MKTKNSIKPAALILIADDDPSIRLMTRHILERDGHTVVEAADGQQALAIYKQKQPDLVLLDAMMPVLDGFITCEQLRQLPGGDRVPILIITVLDDADSVSRAFEAGATDYIIKPIHWVVLRRRVKQQLQAAQMELTLRESEELYRILVETSPNAIALIDLNFVVIFCNQQTVHLHGYQQINEIIGKSALELIAYEDQNRLREALRGTLGNNSTGSLECSLIKRNSSNFFAQLNISKLSDATGKPEGFVIVSRDISKQKQAEAEIRQRNRELTLLIRLLPPQQSA